MAPATFTPSPTPSATATAPPPQTLNGYAYVVDNPVTWIDPSGGCYGPMSYLRDLEPVSCNNMDLANLVWPSTIPTALRSPRSRSTPPTMGCGW